MSVMSLTPRPNFTPLARQRWDSIPGDIRQRLLSDVLCTRCSGTTTMTSFGGLIKNDHLVLSGKCSKCHGNVARVIGAKESTHP